jgi:hypothetical protein
MFVNKISVRLRLEEWNEKQLLILLKNGPNEVAEKEGNP